MKDRMRLEVERFIEGGRLNRLEDGTAPYYDRPLVGFASAADPLFTAYKEIIGPFHMTPREYFEEKFGAGSMTGGTVIVWVLPFSEELRRRSRKGSTLPEREWSHGRYYGEMVNDALRRYIVDFLSGEGYRALAPSLSPLWERVHDSRVGHASRWSERHAAYAAGLGTFSLSDGLITARGIAHRVGSVVTDLLVACDQRPYSGAYDYCLKYRANTCGACVKRCPAGAIGEKGHDKDLCFAYARNVVIPAVNHVYGVTTPSCGLCQIGVPCESAIPEPPSGNA